MRKPRTARTRRERRSQRGATLVEGALSAGLFFALLFAVIEAGMLMSDYGALSGGVRSATRAATTKGNDADSDYVILQQLKKDLAGMTRGDVTKIVVFKASGPGASVPSSCLTATVHIGVTNSEDNVYCNVYSADDLISDVSNFGCETIGPQYFDCGWDPTTRKASVGAGSTPDYIGVYVAATHMAVTGFFGKSYSMSSTAVYPIEPRLLQ